MFEEQRWTGKLNEKLDLSRGVKIYLLYVQLFYAFIYLN